MSEQPDKLVVSQEAREFAADVATKAARCTRDEPIIKDMLAGKHDDSATVQAFQRAMNQAADERQEMCAKVLWKIADDLEHEPPAEFDDHRQFAAGRAHQARMDEIAIRSIGKGGM